MKNTGKFIGFGAVALIAVFAIVFIGVSLTSNSKPVKVTDKNKLEILNKLYSDIDVTKEKTVKGSIDLNPANVASELPSINKFEVPVKNTTNDYVEIFSSTEKSGTGVDGWINKVADDFNQTNVTVDGKQVSVKIRNIASGTATDFIKSKKYIPDGFTPSNELWGEMTKAGGVKTEIISNRMVGNVPGILLKNSKYNEIKKKYGKIDAKTVIKAMANNELTMGYTDPYASSTGLNLLISILHTFDAGNLLGNKAVSGFEKFQNNVPFTALTTLQMRDAAKSGTLDGFVMEYQTFSQAPDLKANYTFTPFGVRHDSPLYALGNISSEKKQILQKFSDFSKQAKYQDLGSKYGFNHESNYKSEYSRVDGATLSSAQALWKEKKDLQKPISAVFVADTSGSMGGAPLNQLKKSLLQSQKYLGRQNSIGLVSYANDVSINLPIGKYTLEQQSKFVGAVERLEASGGTATYDGIIVAIRMLQDQMKKNPNTRPIIFVLTDGETNGGHSLDEVKGLIKAYKMPVYTIGYNANLKDLEKVSSINEAASINADTDDVIYKIKNLFNVQL
ncbi:VWA domain-containing protein [Sporolactobacillus shoreicorticis]|uniref:VWA domain-containing protein n=1 Tax=Sporolactobacillus shoreicorticis TaxID=1923877 RepID=A0ABW5S3N3_9BACL|nr:VWA domain-containing protein [Sporolactobacillus shoreicorticis]MCO7126463.1 VWA domain-containing protein [Sporolactobacillus shoreicorticis]